MRRVLEVGPRRLSVVEALPFVEGESARILKEVEESDPLTLAVDLPPSRVLELASVEALKPQRPVLPPFHDRLVHDLLSLWVPTEKVHPYEGALRWARSSDVTVVPLQEKRREPGPLLRFRVERASRSLRKRGGVEGKDPRELHRAIDEGLRRVPPYLRHQKRVEEESAVHLLETVLEERAPRLVALLSYPSSERILERIVRSFSEKGVKAG